MYQNLRQLLTAEQTNRLVVMPASIILWYLRPSESYDPHNAVAKWRVNSMSKVDVMIEESVASMQVVIELGRVIRDRKVMPVKVCVL